MGENNKGGLLLAGVAATVAGAALLLKTDKGKQLLKDGGEKLKEVGEAIAEGAVVLKDEMVETGREVTASGLDLLGKGIDSLKEKIKKPEEPEAGGPKDDGSGAGK